jgi:prepilin-type N-terminal cleavage/methylation domain-containing protein
MNTQRPGFTLAETLVVVVLGAVVMSSIYQMVVIQEKTTRHQHAVISTSENVQAALAIIGNDLKEVSARDGDIVEVDSTSITFRALRQAGIVCNKSALNVWIDVWELGGPIATGDSILVFDEGANTNSPADDSWLRMVVGTAGASNCGTNPLGVASTRRLTVLTAPFTTVTAGAPVRAFTHARYRLTDSGEWGQLMRREGLGTETPIIEQLATGAEGGLRMRFFDSTGVAIPLNNLTARRAEIMRIQMKVSGKAMTNASSTGENRWRDSLLTQVYLRGNARGQ